MCPLSLCTHYSLSYHFSCWRIPLQFLVGSLQILEGRHLIGQVGHLQFVLGKAMWAVLVTLLSFLCFEVTSMRTSSIPIPGIRLSWLTCSSLVSLQIGVIFFTFPSPVPSKRKSLLPWSFRDDGLALQRHQPVPSTPPHPHMHPLLYNLV